MRGDPGDELVYLRAKMYDLRPRHSCDIRKFVNKFKNKFVMITVESVEMITDADSCYRIRINVF